MVAKVVKDKKVTVGIDVRGKNFNHKAKHAVSFLKRAIKKHFRTDKYAISVAANNLIWKKGRANAPSKITLVGTVKNGKTYLFLDTPEDLKKKAELFEKKEVNQKSTKFVENAKKVLNTKDGATIKEKDNESTPKKKLSESKK